MAQGKQHQSVEIVERPVDWNNLAWGTLLNLGATGHSSGTDWGLYEKYRDTVLSSPLVGGVFANPMFRVTGPASAEFIRRSRQAQHAWLARFRRDLPCSASTMQRMMRHRHYIMRSLEFTGAMVIDHVFFPPHMWASLKFTAPAKDLSGQTFGRLTVQGKSSEGRWYCVCQCGGVNRVLAKHLLSGATRSCGCLVMERDERLRHQRRDRNRNYSARLDRKGG